MNSLSAISYTVLAIIGIAIVWRWFDSRRHSNIIARYKITRDEIRANQKAISEMLPLLCNPTLVTKRLNLETNSKEALKQLLDSLSPTQCKRIEILRSESARLQDELREARKLSSHLKFGIDKCRIFLRSPEKSNQHYLRNTLPSLWKDLEQQSRELNTAIGLIRTYTENAVSDAFVEIVQDQPAQVSLHHLRRKNISGAALFQFEAAMRQARISSDRISKIWPF